MAEPENTEVEETEETQAEETQTEDTTTEETKVDETEEQKDDEKTVPYERVKALTDTVTALTEKIGMLEQQAAVAKANPVQGQQQQQQFDIFKEVGLDPNDPADIPTQEQLKGIFSHYGTVFDRRVADIAFQQAHPDFAELVGTADEIASGSYAEPLSAAIKDNPALAKMIGQSADPRLAAYGIAKLQKGKTKAEKPIDKDEAKEAIDEAVKNSKKVKSSSNVKGGAALSEAGRYSTMPDKDFLKLAAEHGAIV